ncbi:MAG: tetratricopeptide repeat protein [Verrucomicrobiales bacterium]|nr:tetratricopeptide repeat protein [Verrucomicrobiales bacterium]
MEDESNSEEIRRLVREGEVAAAAARLPGALAAGPGDAGLAIVATEVFRRVGRLDEALAAGERAVTLAPGEPAAWNNRGLVRLDGDDPAGAEADFRQAVSCRPGYDRGRYNLAQAWIAQGRTGEAIALLEELLARVGTTNEAGAGSVARLLGSLGQARVLAGNVEGGLRDLREAHRRQPEGASIALNLAGALLAAGGKAGEAEAGRLLQEAVRRHPDSASAWHDLGAWHERQERLVEARECHVRALELRPGNLRALAALVDVRRRLCDWSAEPAEGARLRTAVRLALRAGRSCPVGPAASLRQPFSAAEQYAIARAEGRRLASRVPVERYARQPKKPGDQIRLGFFSREFAHSVAGHLAQGLFGRFDRNLFEVWACDYSPDDGSAVRRRILGDCDGVLSLRELSDAAAARAIAAAGIDILVEITSYLPGGRPGVLARRPGRVQLSYLYPASLGADFIDYFLTDAVVSPPGDEAYFSEKLVRLPGCYLPANGEQAIAAETPDRAHWGLPEEPGFVFASFNAPDKIDAATYDCWMRLLAAVPGSVLWQRVGRAGDVVAENLRREARLRGIDGERIVFAPPVPRVEDHLARHRHADVLLDTFIHGAHATAMDALWAGLPVLTCPGQTLASRVAASLLTAAGLPELIAGSRAEYERLGVSLARDRLTLRALRERLLESKKTGRLYDGDRLVRELERAFLGMVS